MFAISQVVKRKELMESNTHEGCAEVISVWKGGKGLTTRKTSIKLRLTFFDTSYVIIDDLTGYVDIDSTITYLAICSTEEPGVCDINYKSVRKCK